METTLVSYLAELREGAVKRSLGSAEELVRRVEDIADLCTNLTAEDELAFASSVLFDEDSGIFAFLDAALPEKALAKAREKALAFVAKYVEKVKDRIAPYAILIRKKCYDLYRRETSNSPKANTFDPLFVITRLQLPLVTAENFAAADMGRQYFGDYRRMTTATLKSNTFVMMGLLVEYFPAAMHDQIAPIMNLALTNLMVQAKSDKPEMLVMAGILDCMTSLLTQCDEGDFPGGSQENAQLLYKCVTDIILKDDLTRYAVLRSALRLLSRHAGLFRRRLLKDIMRKDPATQSTEPDTLFEYFRRYSNHVNHQIRDAANHALEETLTQVSKAMLESDAAKEPQVRFTYTELMKAVFGILNDAASSPRDVSLAIRAQGKLAGAILRFSGEEELRKALNRLLPFGAQSHVSTGYGDDNLGHSVTLVGAFADMMVYLPSVEDSLISFVSEVAGAIFFRYPLLWEKQKPAVHTAFVNMLCSLYPKGEAFTSFLNNIVRSSLVRTISADDPAAPPDDPKKWPLYLELWTRILDQPVVLAAAQNARKEEASEADSETPVASRISVNAADYAHMRELVYDSLVQNMLTIVGGLDLRYDVKAPSREGAAPSEDDGGKAPEDVEPELALESIVPLNPNDMRMLLTLVEFAQEFLQKCCVSFFPKWLYTFGRDVIALSDQYPLISGFYKLLAVAIRVGDALGYFAAEVTSAERDADGDVPMSEASPFPGVPPGDREQCTELFRKFLREVLVASRRYKLEHLSACLQMCLSAPTALLEIRQLVGPMQSALTMGLRYPSRQGLYEAHLPYQPLADLALDTLEGWLKNHFKELEPHLPEIVPLLNDYLAEVDTSGGDQLPGAAGDEVAERRNTADMTRTQARRQREARAKDMQASPFERLQLRVQRFLGRIGGHSHLLVPGVNLTKGNGQSALAWDVIKRIKFALPFQNEKPDIYLDPLLPRVVELAQSSTDRRTKVAASELLHAVSLYMIGTSAKAPLQRRGEELREEYQFHKIYRKLFPALLKLATDVEPVTQRLFSEFVKQIIRWFTSSKTREHPETMALLDAILEGLVDEDNGALREFSAGCFQEFMEWSIRHAPPEADNFVNVASMLRRLYNRLDHPNPYQRLGATMALYRLYPLLVKQRGIVDRHIFELFFYCAKSLRLAEADAETIGTVRQMSRVVHCLQKLMLKFVDPLKKPRKDGRPMFATVDQFLGWLFTQTGRPQQRCSQQCMILFSALAPESAEGSAAVWFRSKISPSIPLEALLEPFDVQHPLAPGASSPQELQQGLSSSLQSLRWYEWALSQQLLTVAELVPAHGAEETRPGHPVVCLRTFLSSTADEREDSALEARLRSLTPSERESFHRTRCSTIMGILSFIHQVVKRSLGESTLASGSVKNPSAQTHWTDVVPVDGASFHRLMCLLLLRPRSLGFVTSDLKQSDRLAKASMNLMRELAEASPAFKEGVGVALRSLMEEPGGRFDLGAVSLDEVLGVSGRAASQGAAEMLSLVRGYQQLFHAGALTSILPPKRLGELAEKLASAVFNLKRECPPSLRPVATAMLELATALGLGVGRLLDLVSDESEVVSGGGVPDTQGDTPPGMVRRVTAGALFLSNFSDVIVRRCVFQPRSALERVFTQTPRNGPMRALLGAILDHYLAGGDKLSRASVVDQMAANLRYLQRWTEPTASLEEKRAFLAVVGKLLVVDGGDPPHALAQPAARSVVPAYEAFLSQAAAPGETESERGLRVSLKREALGLLPFFLGPGVDGETRRRVLDSVRRLVAEHLLIQSRDLPQGSPQYNNYVRLLEGLLRALVASQSLGLLEELFPVLQFQGNTLRSRRIEEALGDFAGETARKEPKPLLELTLTLLHDGDKQPRLKKAVMDMVAVPALHAADETFLSEWFADKFEDFKRALSKEYSYRTRTDAETEQTELTTRTATLSLLELMYLRLSAEQLREECGVDKQKNVEMIRLCDDVIRSKERLKVMGVAPEQNPESARAWRGLQQAAYGCLAALLIKTQGPNFFPRFLFKEGAKEGFLWSNVVDCDKVYDHFDVETAELGSARETLRGLRAERKARESRRMAAGAASQAAYATLSSQYINNTSSTQGGGVISTFLGGQGARLGADGGAVLAGSQGGSLPLGGTQSDLSASLLPDAAAAPLGVYEGFGEPGAPADEESIVETSALDEDDFDQNPVMAVFLRVLEHLHQKQGGAEPAEMPPWMDAIHKSFTSPATPINVKLFLAKAVVRARKLFQPFKREWFAPLIEIFTADPSRSGGASFHYFLRNVCIVLLQWDLAKPPNPSKATDLIGHLMRVSAHPTRAVLSANIDVIRLFLAEWKNDVSVDKRVILRYLAADGSDAKMKKTAGLQLFGVLIAVGVKIYDPIEDVASPEKEVYGRLLECLGFKAKEVYEAAAEVIGAALFERDKSPDGDQSLLERPLHQRLLSLYRENSASKATFYNIAAKICGRFPKFVEKWASKVTGDVMSLPGDFKILVLNMLLGYAANLPELFEYLTPALRSLLEHRDEQAQLKTLRILEAILPSISRERIETVLLPVLCPVFSRHDNPECRREFYRILEFLFRPAPDGKGMSDHPQVQRHLLTGLCDPADELREEAQLFWGLQLSQEMPARLVELLGRLYEPELEDKWAQYSDKMLLKLCEASTDYGRPLFDQPLAECHFSEYNIDTAFTGRSLPMTPLFSQSQTATLQELGSQALAPSQTQTGGRTQQQPLPPGMIRATQGPSQSLSQGGTFAPSLSQGDFVSSSLMATQSAGFRGGFSQVGLTQGATQGLGGARRGGALWDTQTNVQRRILKPRTSQVLQGVLGARHRREARASAQAGARAHKVTMMRSYRTGELPDIQIKTEDVLKPLMALAERDPLVARTLSAGIFRGAFALPSTALRVAENDVKRPVREGVAAALARTRASTSFVASLHAICLEDPKMGVNPRSLGDASLRSMNYHSGILVLENQLLDQSHEEGEERGGRSKRQKGRGGQAVPRGGQGEGGEEEQEAWLQLARLYREIGEDDIVLGVLQEKVARLESTREALQAQIAGDYTRAWQSYDKALNEMDEMDEETPEYSKLEADVCYNQRLECLESLTRWQELVDESLEQVTEYDAHGRPMDADTQKLWADDNRDPYLRLFVLSASKVPTQHVALQEFLEASMDDPAKRAQLSDEFGLQLTAMALAGGQYDRARFHLSNCYRNFRRKWGALHPLAVGARHAQAEQLQIMVEFDEFLSFVSSSSGEQLAAATARTAPLPSSSGRSLPGGLVNPDNKDPLRQVGDLLDTWQHRWPSWEHDRVGVWDDVVRHRALCLERAKGHMGMLAQAGHVANYDGTKLAADLAGASSSYFKQAAAGLRKRGDYDVAQEYLKEYDAGRQSLGNPSNQGFDWDFLRLAAKISSLRAERRTRVDPLEAAGQLSQVMRELSDKAEGAGLVNPAGSGNRLDNPGLGVSAPVRLLQADLAAQLARVCVQHHGEIAERLSSGNGMESGSGNGTESWAGFSSGQAIVGNLGAAFRGYSDAVSILDGEGGRPSGNSGAVPSGTDATAEREARRQSKASLKFARFCNDVLQLASGDADQTQNNPPSLPPEIASALAGGTDSGLPPVSNYPPLVIKHVLRALSLDASLKPHQLIPRVLALLGQNKATLKEFEAGVEAVPSWVFIAWVSQILSVMEQPEGRVLARVLERVAEDFPQALYYPFNVSEPAFGDVARERTSRVARLLHNPLLDQFVTALSDLSHPNLKLKDWLSEITMRLQRRDNQGAQEGFREMYRDCLDTRALAAAERQAGDDLLAYARNFESKIVSALEKDGAKLARMSVTEYKNAISSTSHVLNNEDLVHGKMQLSRFSKWLADYDQSRGAAPPRGARGKLPRGTISDFAESDAGGIEVPGQYGGFHRPDPGSHVTIVGFDQTLTCFSSIRRPKVLIIRGSDEKEYRFVVKGGEDLRLDQRIEQLFEVMNNALRVDPMCARRRLGVRTYGAIPVSSRCGLLEFVSPTRTIHDVIASGLASSLNLQTPDAAKTLLSDVQKSWQQCLTSHTGAVSSLQEAYQKSYTSLSRQSFEAQLGVAEKKVPGDALRAGIAQQAPGAESFLALRGQFARSLAALSICGYVAGVGDRHLQNFLLDVADGTLVPIDFGYSFGTATQMLPVPELVPFRLTRQFAQLLRPLDTLDLLKIDMTRVMTVLQENKDVLVAVMDVFVKEPLVDWRNESLKRRAALGAKGRKGAVAALRDGDEDEQMELLEQEHVSLKIENAARKLARWNPAEVTLAELQQSMVNGKPFFRSLEGIVRGDPRMNARAKVDGKVCATVEQQVKCLIDQATDPNLVGRMWIGWAPWV